MPTTARASQAHSMSPALVAVAAWLLPGLGYVLIGQRSRGITVGLTVIVLFVAGLLIGGVRVLEVPGYGPHGQPVLAYRIRQVDPRTGEDLDFAYQFTEDKFSDSGNRRLEGEAIFTHPIEEIRAKPWSIAQIITGPVGIIAGVGAVAASRRGEDDLPIGARSHSRLNEIGVLYTAIAGMLNLLAIIDSHSRASENARVIPQEAQ